MKDKYRWNDDKNCVEMNIAERPNDPEAWGPLDDTTDELNHLYRMLTEESFKLEVKQREYDTCRRALNQESADLKAERAAHEATQMDLRIAKKARDGDFEFATAETERADRAEAERDAYKASSDIRGENVEHWRKRDEAAEAELAAMKGVV